MVLYINIYILITNNYNNIIYIYSISLVKHITYDVIVGSGNSTRDMRPDAYFSTLFPPLHATPSSSPLTTPSSPWNEMLKRHHSTIPKSSSQKTKITPPPHILYSPS